MYEIPSIETDFKIRNLGPVSDAFERMEITTFSNACTWVKQLPYRRNSHKMNAMVVMEEACGTCSTKHALLKILAAENDFQTVELCLGIYRFHSGNAVAAGPILKVHGLPYLPEAHYFLRILGKFHDLTFPSFEIPELEKELLWETEVSPQQLGAAKDQIHRDFLATWLQQNPAIGLGLDELWDIREKCIFALSEP